MSKLQRLRDNIAAISHALTSTSEYNHDILNKYTGFGGLGFVLNPLDRKAWTKSDMDCFEDTVRLHEILREESSDEREYQQWAQSLKASVLTAFYTPRELVKELMMTLYEHIKPRVVLDPAAGNGVFLKYMAWLSSRIYPYDEATAYEKDLLTGLILDRKEGRKNRINISGFETIDNLSLGRYDLVSTNVPFGDIAVFDPEYTNSKSAVRRAAAKMIHRYYVLKGLDCLRDGGIEAYIITSNYLNRDSEQLAEALKVSRLIGAYRLANNLFKESGTEVGTDLLVLQKDSEKQGLTADESFLLTAYEDGGCPTNMYFECYPDHVIATSCERDTDAYGKPGFVYQHKDGVSGISKDMAVVLSADLTKNLDVNLTQKAQKAQKATAGKREKKAQTEEEKMTEQLLKSIHECHRRLYEYEQREQKEQTTYRKDLNSMYDRFVSEHGPLNSTANAKMVKAVSAELLALEVRGERGWEKADIFSKPVAFSTDDLHEAGTPQEALAQSLNDYGKPDMEYMCAMTGLSEDELTEALDGEIFWDPISEEWQIKARFICGNVIEKIETIKRKYGFTGPDFDISKCRDNDKTTTNPTERQVRKALAALEAAVPTPIPFEDLDFNLGERWIDTKLYSDFASEFFSMPDDSNSYWSGKVEVTVKYDRVLDQYTASADHRNQKIYTQYSVSSEGSQDIDGMGMLQHALLNTCPKMMKYRRDEKGRCLYNNKGEHLKTEDHEKTQLANTKIEEIRQGWNEWLLRQPKELQQQLADVYNRQFNCFVKPRYDGSHQTFPGVDWQGLEKKYGIPVPTKDGKGGLYQSQKDCVWMLCCNGGGICDHEVGSGKTLIMCVTAHEMKRLGLVHKPMIIGLKANVSAIAETYRTAYPQAKILYASSKDYSAKERTQFFNNMKNNDYDCVIMSHDQFGRIPQSDEIQMEVYEDEMQQLEDALNAIKGWNYSNQARVRKGLERRKKNLGVKIQQLQHDIEKRKDAVVDFQMMGIDHIFIDESHYFKNLGFSTRHDRVAGLGDSEGSKRAYNLLMAIRTIQKRTGRDLGATFLSGTTVTNSLTELYSLFRYLRPQALAKQQITCFDAWAAIFTKKSQEYEFGMTNEIVLKERFRYFIKVPELAQFYNEITDFRTAEDVGIERPERHTMLLNIKPTPDQEEFIQKLKEFAQTGNFDKLGVYSDKVRDPKAKMLYATDYARKMSLDMRLLGDYADHPGNKASKCACLLKRYYDRYNDVKGTQLVFSDLSAYDPKKWNIYTEIKRKLVDDYGIPEDEIRFIQECKCESKKEALIKQVNEGKVRILFGSTQMLGTGVNAQQRIVAVHHLDTPWRPSDLEQRDGRAIRKGNEIAKLYADNKVDIIIYAVERSLDSYKFNLLHCKQTFIQQLKRGQLAKRTLDEGAMDEKTGMNFAEYMAILSGNTDLLERAKLEKRIVALEGERKNFLREQRENEARIASLLQTNEHYRQHISDAEGDWQKFTAAGPDPVNTATLDGFTVPDGFPVGSDDYDKAIGERLLQLEKTARTQGIHIAIGTLYGFRLVVKTTEHRRHDAKGNEFMEYENRFFVEGNHLYYSHNDGYLNHASPRISGQTFLNAMLHLPEIIKDWQHLVARTAATIGQLRQIAAQPWAKEGVLRRLKADLAKLDRKINQELHKDERKEEYKQAA